MADVKKASAGELAKQFVKEVASGAFGGTPGAANRATSVIKARKNAPEGITTDANTYHSRQHTDDANP
jgi:hypothetical protein